MAEDERIPTTHAGSLPRPEHLLELYTQEAPQETIDEHLQTTVSEIVAQQLDVGLDIVNDGEYGKPVGTNKPGYGHATWGMYVRDRLSGFEWVPEERPPGESKDRRAFKSFYGGGGADRLAAARLVRKAGEGDNPPLQWTCTGPISYSGQRVVERDISNLKRALEGCDYVGAFLPVASPNSISMLLPNTYYPSPEEYTAAIAEAMRVEYGAIAEAGLTVQVDDPMLVVMWDLWSSDRTFAEWRSVARMHVELLNHALSDVPESQVRYHLCWGSGIGPHSSDVPLADAVDILLEVRAGAYSLEAANPRHEHEWRVWEDVRLPDGKKLIPGVVTHKTDVLEHPEVVAERLIRYADCVGRENIIAGTDCGMGGRLDADLAWAKLSSLVQGAEIASRRLWRSRSVPAASGAGAEGTGGGESA